MNLNYAAGFASFIAAVVFFLTLSTALGAVFLAVGAVFVALGADEKSDG